MSLKRFLFIMYTCIFHGNSYNLHESNLLGHVIFKRTSVHPVYFNQARGGEVARRPIC